MRLIEDSAEVETILRKYEFEFVKSVPSLQGNVEPLTDEDIDNVLYDMQFGSMGAKVYEDNGKVVVEYPNDICRLESRAEIASEKESS